MYLTAFLPFFLLLVLYAFRGPAQWAIATGIAAFFQAATPILVFAGGRASGLAPAYCLLFVGLWHVYGMARARSGRYARQFDFPAATWWLLGFTVIGVVGAIVWPRFFEGWVRALPSREGLGSGFVEPVRPVGTNYIQAFYLLCNFLLFAVSAYLVQIGAVTRETMIKGVVSGAVISVTIGVYQLVAYHFGLPWPSGVINSNIGVAQLLDQTALGFKRMSSTFLEPSQMALHLLGVFGIVGLGLRRKWLGGMVLAALMISTSSTAYFGLAILLIIWTALDLPARGLKVLPIALAILVVVPGTLVVDHLLTGGRLAEGLIFRKFEGGSGESRLYADWLAMRTFFDSYGLGVGVGSARASSIFATLAATTGIPGLLAFGAFVVAVLRGVGRSPDDRERALLFGLIGLLVGWAISTPDLVFPLFWVLAGVAAGASSRGLVVAPSDRAAHGRVGA